MLKNPEKIHFSLRAAVGAIVVSLFAGWLFVYGNPTDWMVINPDNSQPEWSKSLNAHIDRVGGVASAMLILAVVLFLAAYPLRFLNRWAWLQRQVSSRRLRLYAKIIAPCLCVLVIFYLEEDARGRFLWHQYRRQMEAQGEHFYWKHYVPPGVPEKENFMFAPIMQAACHWGQTNRFDFATNPLNFKLERTGCLPPVGSFEAYVPPRLPCWLQGTMTDLAAWQFYFRLPQDTNAASPPHPHSLTNEFPVAAQPQSPAEDVLLALSKYGPAIEALREASHRPYSRAPLDYESPKPIQAPHWQVLKSTRDALALRTSAELAAGRTDEALADVQLMLALARSIEKEPFVRGQENCRLLMIEKSLQPIWEGLATHRWSARQLDTLDQELGRIDLLQTYDYVVHAALARELQATEYYRQNPLERNVTGDFDAFHLWANTFLLRNWPGGWFSLNERELALASTAGLPTPEESKKRIFSTNILTRVWERYQSWPENETFHPFSPLCMTRQMFSQSVWDEDSWTWSLAPWPRAQTGVDLARVSIALERWHQTEGVYPENLKVLVPRYLASLPRDIVTGNSLHYRLTHDGNFLLYSVGWDGKDDHGTPPHLPNGLVYTIDLPGGSPAPGDWVWRYSMAEVNPGNLALQ